VLLFTRSRPPTTPFTQLTNSYVARACSLLCLWVSGVGCETPPAAAPTPNGPGVSFPLHLGEGHGDSEDVDRQTTASANAPSASPPLSRPKPSSDAKAAHRKRYGSQPDPAPLASPEQWEVTVLYDRGRLSLTQATRRHLAKPLQTARRMGRFAAELWIGRELIERVRFDFPLVMDTTHEVDKPLTRPIRMDEGARSTQTLLIPDSERATRLVLVDRATGQETELAWPPTRPTDREPSASVEVRSE